jgi:hypothetical protein
LNARVDSVSLIAVGAGLAVPHGSLGHRDCHLLQGNGQSVVADRTGSVGVMGTVVGAYFGVKLGADKTAGHVARSTHRGHPGPGARRLPQLRAGQTGPEGSGYTSLGRRGEQSRPLDRLL